MKIAIGNDHAAPELKLAVKAHLEEKGIEVVDMGCAPGEKCDYPDAAAAVCRKVTGGECTLGILICGTGLGMSYAANKIKGMRAALCGDCYSAKYTRLHNDANALCMGGRVTGAGLALEIVDTFLSTGFEGGRHQRRIDKISALEK